MKNCILSCLVLGFFMLCSSCGISRIIGENEVLYKKSLVIFEDKSSIPDDAILESEIQSKIYPKPNKKFLGLFYTKLWISEHVEPKENRTKGFKHWLKKKFAEKPVLLTDIDPKLMENLIAKTMQDFAFFNTEVSHRIVQKNQKGAFVYKIEHGLPQIIDSIIFSSKSQKLDSLIRNYKDLKTQEKQAYNLKKLQSDRLALAEEIRSHGFFDFDEQDIYFVIDTSLAGDFVDVHFKIKDPDEGGEHKVYYIQDVVVNSTFQSGELIKNEQSYADSFEFKNYIFKQDYKFIGKRALAKNIIIEPGSIFSVEDYNFTVERLNNLGIFNYVMVNYQKIGEDSLRVDIQLSPGKHQSVRADVEATTSNRSFLGSSVSVTYNNRNLFHGAENLELKAAAGTEFQFVNGKAALNILNVDFKASIGIPRLLTVFKSPKVKSGVPPKTSINLEESYQQWLQYFTMNSFSMNYTYDWRTKKKHHHVLTPLLFNVISLVNTTDEFNTILQNSPILATSFNSSVILGRNYNYTMNTRKDADDKRYISFNGFVESVGNTSYLMALLFKKNGPRPYEILNIPFSQYAKFEAELKHHWQINQGSSLVSRWGSGIGIAYGNSEVLPYIKQFYMGGPNTVRAFAFRSLGPGSFSSANESNGGIVNPIQQSGDIKLIANVEYRYNIFKFLKGAFFLDAGNVWLRKEDQDRPGSQFLWGEFYKQIALGTGFGLRLDFDFFAIRSDIGIPLYKPYNNDGDRWINQFPEQGFNDWRKKNVVWNIAIGYPF